MKFLTIKGKITLWYTFFMVVMALCILGIIGEFADKTIIAGHKNILLEVVEDAAEDIEEGDSFDLFEDGVYLLKYDKNKKYIEGIIPEKFSAEIILSEGHIQTVKNSNEIFYVYDKKSHTENGEIFWIRGVIPNVKTAQMTTLIVRGTFIVLPFLVILSAVIGYIITKRAFEPVKKIQETAQSITDSEELSLRIGLPEGKDEISKLGKTIDNMLDRLEKSFEQEKQFTSDASHELRTPVAVIMAESDYILQHGTDFQEARESMEVISRQADKMSKLIEQLFFFARAEQGRINLNYEDIDVSKIIKEIAEENKIEAQKKNISIKISDTLPKGKKYYLDRVMFSSAVQNVVRNAAVYGKESGWIEINILEQNDFLAVKIKDNGIGISRENLKKIWDRFFQGEEARTAQTTGSMGLGLSMVKWITEKHGGFAEAESVLGEGSIFTLFFPIDKK